MCWILKSKSAATGNTTDTVYTAASAATGNTTDTVNTTGLIVLPLAMPLTLSIPMLVLPLAIPLLLEALLLRCCAGSLDADLCQITFEDRYVVSHIQYRLTNGSGNTLF